MLRAFICWLCSGGLRRELAAQEIANSASNLLMVGFQCEVTRVVEMHLSVRVVALERFSAWSQEERFILAPYCQQGRLLYAEIFLELGIVRNVAAIVQKEAQLILAVAWPFQQPQAEIIRFRTYLLLILH